MSKIPRLIVALQDVEERRDDAEHDFECLRAESIDARAELTKEVDSEIEGCPADQCKGLVWQSYWQYRVHRRCKRSRNCRDHRKENR